MNIPSTHKEKQTYHLRSTVMNLAEAYLKQEHTH